MERVFIGVLWLLFLCPLRLLGAPLTIYTELFPPDQYLASDGRLTGYVVEVVQEIQARTGNQDPIQVVPWVKAYREIQERPNTVLFSMARIPERVPLFHWVGPVKEARSELYVIAGSKVSRLSLPQAKALRRIGVYRDDARDQHLTRMGFANLDRSIDPEVILKKLLLGRVDAMACAPDIMPDLLKALGRDSSAIRPVCSFLKTPIYIAISKGTSPEVVKAWGQALEGMRQDGSLQRIYRAYYPQGVAPGS